jgi:hypothetical protein
MGALDDAYLRDIARTFRNYKTLGERAMAQVPERDLATLVDADANSIAIVVKHIAGNLRSRFTDFLTTDGEKPTRRRDDEFEIGEGVRREEILGWWETGWSAVLGSVDALTPADLLRSVHIRGEAFLVVEALNRSAAHTAYHVGQIVMLAKHFAGPRWTSLSIPKGQSARYSTGTFKEGIIPSR